MKAKSMTRRPTTVSKMKGKAVTDPNNAVKWMNGFVSNMPDWKTARECANASEMLFVLKRCRSLLLEIDREVQVDPAVFKLIQDVCERADGTVAIREALEPSAPVAKPFPKPPGF
jgi:hypothetical protein